MLPQLPIIKLTKKKIAAGNLVKLERNSQGLLLLALFLTSVGTKLICLPLYIFFPLPTIPNR